METLQTPENKANNGLLAQILERALGIDPIDEQKLIAAIEAGIKVYGRKAVVSDVYKVADEALGLPK